VIPVPTTAAAKLFPSGPRVNKRSPTATDKAVGTKIRALRRAAGMTLQEIGEAVGVSFVQFQRYETGASRMSASRLVAVSVALGVRLDCLIAEPGPAEAELISDRERSENEELARLFKAISDPKHRLAIIALARAIAAGDEPSHSLSEELPKNSPVMTSGSNRETKQ
jgi:transcriptional regulator with XRE-family HTH domain